MTKKVKKSQTLKKSVNPITGLINRYTGFLNRASLNAANLVLRGLGVVGEALVSGASTDFGLTSPFTFPSGEERRNIHLSRENTGTTALSTVGPWLSPTSHVAAWVQGSVDPRIGFRWIQGQDGRLQLASAVTDMFLLGRIPALRNVPSVVDEALARTGNKGAIGRTISRLMNDNILSTILAPETYEPQTLYTRASRPRDIDYSNSGVVYRAPALKFKLMVDKGEIDLNDPNTAVIEIKSHLDGHATVNPRHLVRKTKDGVEDITYSFNGKYRPNLLLQIFDDSHLITELTKDQVLEFVNRGKWKGSEVAKNPRDLKFLNITPELADLLIDFVENNPGKDVYVHCLQGVSRSGAVDKFLGDYYGYNRPIGKTVDRASPEVYNALVEAYTRKHGGYSYLK